LLPVEPRSGSGRQELIGFLKKNQISYTIATASDLQNVLFFFDYLQLDALFDQSKVVFNDGKTLSKPHPQMSKKPCNPLEQCQKKL
jgi:beta-phosphoglucomutase-like phosphatase (HAD superfamily)